MANAMMMDDRKRALLEARVMERLHRLDESTLRDLDNWLAQPVSGSSVEPGARRRGMTRRQALGAALFGGIAATGTGLAGTLIGQTGAMEDGATRIAALNQTVDDWQGRADEWRGRAESLGERFDSAMNLVNLYDDLENVGLDGAISAGMAAVAGAIGGTAQFAQTLREGLQVARNNINQLDEGLAILDNGLVRAEGAVSRLGGLLQALEDRLRAAGEPVAPLSQAIGSFFGALIGRIPFGVGERIMETIQRVQDVLGAIPESIENINSDLIEPLRARFFPRDGEDVTVRLLDPLTALVFTPADRLLGTLAALAETWQDALERPTGQKLAARDEIRKQIAKYRTEKNL